MPRFFITAAQRDGDQVRIGGADGVHLARALRTRPGDHLSVVDDEQREHTLVVERVAGEEVHARVVSTRAATGEPRLQVHVVQAIPQQGMEACIEALVVAGAASIRPVVTTRSIRRPAARRAEARVERWQSIAREAAQLAGRARVPQVHDVLPLAAAIGELPDDCPILACVITRDAAPVAGHRLGSREAAVVIGPEGGLDRDDMDVLRARRASLVHLGERTAPARLAGALALTLLLAANRDLARTATPAREHS